MRVLRLLFACVLCVFLNRCSSPDNDSTPQSCLEIGKLNNSARKFLLNRPDSAFVNAGNALKISENFNCVSGKAESHQIIGEVFFHQGVYQESIHQLLESFRLFEQLGDRRKMAETYNQQGLVYYGIKQPALALEFHQKALQAFQELNDSLGIAYSFGCLGRLSEKRGDYSRALEYQEKALHFYEHTDDQRGLAIILENIGSIYEDKGDNETALGYFTRSLELNRKTNDSLSMIVNLNNIGDNYRKTGNYVSAIEWTQQAVALANRLNDRYQLSAGYKDLSKIYSLAGDYKKAYENLEIGRNLYQDMYTQDAERQLSLFQTLFEIERKNHDIESLEASEQLSTLIKIALSSSLFLIVLLGVVIISRQRLKIRRNKELMTQQQQIYDTENKLLHAEIENNLLREQKLEHELETKASSLASHTLHVISKNKILEDIQQRLSNVLQERSTDSRSQIKSIVKMIEHNFVQDKDWDDFRQIFDQVHQDFFKELKKIAPDLSPAEIRLAALLRLKIDSKDISVLLGISKDSLRIARYRLRKKLHLQQGDSLSGYIRNL